jgi:aspartate ammonia-lyase
MEFRTETDSLGEKQVPANAYFGIATQRAAEVFVTNGIKVPLPFIYAVAKVKLAAAMANLELGKLDADTGQAIVDSINEILAGKFDDQFVLEELQGGATTSINMNVNEVVANRALELLGKNRGDYHSVSPNDHVNLGQSTNDVVPTALRIVCLDMTAKIELEVDRLIEAMAVKANEFKGVKKLGRTHLQDAVPMTLESEFLAWTYGIKQKLSALPVIKTALQEVNLGGTAIGTGVGASDEYRRLVITKLASVTGWELHPAIDLIGATQSQGALVDLSGWLKGLMLEMIKVANDMRLLSSGPRGGIGEIILPEIQPGSSIMPGKINPVIPEFIDQIGFVVMGNDGAVDLAAQAGQLELNTMLPVIAAKLLDSMVLIGKGLEVFREKCINGIQANADECRKNLENSTALATLVSKKIGYLNTAALAKECIKENKSFKEVVVEKGLMNEAEFDSVNNF